MNIPPLLRSFNWPLNLAVLFLLSAGLLSLASTSPTLFYRQIVWAALGLALIIFIIKFDWRPFVNYRGVIFGFYFLIAGLLVLTLLLAPKVRGAQSWLFIGHFQLQSSELMKLALIIIYSFLFNRKHASMARIPNLLASFIYFLIPAFLIALQPDLGSVVVLFVIWLGFLLIAGLSWRYLVAILIIASLLGVVMWQSYLRDYQKERILGFIFPGRDPLGINYSVIQAKIAIGSAGLLGKGFQQGSQAQLGFLPERQTDFIFAALVEEWGLFSGILVVLIFLLLIFQIIKIGLNADNNFNRFMCLGAAIFFSTQFVFNIGSNLGLVPVVGITFPFLSYGGSSLLTDLILVGIIQSIFSRRSL